MMKSIQSRLALLMAGMLALILGVNLFVYTQVGAMMRRIDRVFVSNVSIVELTAALDDVQENVYEYLNTRSSSSLENFYRYEQNLRNLTGELNHTAVDSETLMLEKNISSMSESYLSVAEQAVQAKRGRNVEEYRSYYESATKLYDYINAYIYELNTLRFAQNSENYQVLLHVMGTLETMSLVLIIVVFLVSLALAITVIRQTIGPLRALAGAANTVAEGNFEVEIPAVRNEDEVGVVTNAFRKMLDSIRQYILDQRVSLETEARMKENELQMEAHLKEAQLRYLQAQINPHFLFNSLNAGSQLATMEGAERTEQFLARMADFFRYNVRKIGAETTLGEEVAAVDNYLYILNVRFAGDIQYAKEIDPAIPLGEIRMPSMILQPIVENAIQHGIHDNHEDGKVLLTVETVSGADNETGRDCIRITVADNGAGMTRDQVLAILKRRGHLAGTDAGNAVDSGDPAEDNGSAGIALGNVISRLELYYNESNLFSIWSDGPGYGTEVTVLLPIETSEEGENSYVSNPDRG